MYLKLVLIVVVISDLTKFILAEENVKFIKVNNRTKLDLENILTDVVAIQVKIGNQNQLCSGTILTRIKVLVPAHCVCLENSDKPRPVTDLKIIQRVKGKIVNSAAHSVKIHENYDGSFTNQHDLAIIETDEPLFDVIDIKKQVQRNEFPKLMNVSDETEQVYMNSTSANNYSQECWAVGWFPQNASLTQLLIKFKSWPVYLMPKVECQKAWRPHVFDLADHHICTYNVRRVILDKIIEDSSTCNMALGDVLICGNLQIGLKTLAGTKCHDSMPTVWTRVDKLWRWVGIESSMRDSRTRRWLLDSLARYDIDFPDWNKTGIELQNIYPAVAGVAYPGITDYYRETTSTSNIAVALIVGIVFAVFCCGAAAMFFM